MTNSANIINNNKYSNTKKLLNTSNSFLTRRIVDKFRINIIYINQVITLKLIFIYLLLLPVSECTYKHCVKFQPPHLLVKSTERFLPSLEPTIEIYPFFDRRDFSDTLDVDRFLIRDIFFEWLQYLQTSTTRRARQMRSWEKARTSHSLAGLLGALRPAFVGRGTTVREFPLTRLFQVSFIL